MKTATHVFLKPGYYRSFILFSLVFGILLFALPTSLSAQVTFTALDDLSVNAGVQTNISGGTPTGGVYSGPGVTDDGNGMTYTFDPTVAGLGIHTLTYTVAPNSAMDDVEVLNLLPPAFSKSFDFNEIGPGSVSTLTFTIDNSASPHGVTDLNFIDNLPAGMTIATPANVTHSCGLGTVTAPDGGTTISFAGGTLGALATCTITVDVTSSTPGTHTNTTGDLNSSSGNSGTASANLTVATNRPGFSKSFSPGSVNFGERSTLTFTIDNSANALNMVSLDFTDNLPLGMEVASPPNISIGCSGGTLTAEPGSTIISYDYPVGTPALAAGSTCTISVDVIGTNAGTLNNVTGSLTGQNSSFVFVSSGKASAALEVLTPPEIFLQKSFNPNPASPGGTTNLEFTISNFSRDFEATNVTFSDDLTTVLAGLTATGTPISDVCGTGSVLSGTTVLTLTGATIPAEGSCTFSVPLSVPAGAAGGIYTNTTSAVSGDLNGSTVTGNMANENLTIAYEPTITKNFLNDPIIAGGVTTLEFTITNNDPANSASEINFTDNISAFLSGTTITSLPAAGTCGAGSFFTSFLDLGELKFQMTDGEVPAGSSCTFSIDLLIPTNTPSGTYDNTTSFLSSIVDGDIILANPASDDLEVLAVPSLSKSFTDDPVEEGEIVNLEFELTYDAFASVDATAISFTDDLNAVIPGLAAIGLPLNDVCGVGSQISGTTSLSFTGGTMSPGDVCTFSVPVQVPPGTVPGSYLNTTSPISATVNGQTGTGNPATDNLFIGGLTFTKEFLDDSVIPGDMTTLRFTIDNSTALDFTVSFFTDNLGVTVPGMSAILPAASNTCGTTLSGTTFLIATGGTVTAGTTCTIDVEMIVPPGTASGSYNNITSNLVGDLNGSSVVLDPASDILEVNDNLIALSKTFTDDPVLPGGTVTVEYTLTNLDPVNAVSNIAFTDDFDGLLSGLQATGLPMATCGGTVSGTGLLSFSGGSLAAGASCTFSVTLQTPASAPYGGALPSTTSGVTGEINGLAVVGDPASDDLVFQLLQFSKSFAEDIMHGGSTTLTFTVTNPDPINAVNAIRFTDDLDAVLSGMMATNLPLGDVCGPGSTLTGASVIAFDEGVLNPGQSCSFDVTVEIPCGSVPGTYLNTTSVITATGSAGVLEGDPATDDLTVLSFPISFTAPADLCIDAGVQAGEGNGTPTGGVYSGSGVYDNGNGLDYDFDPAAAGVGVHTITYTYMDGNGCVNSAADDVEVFDLPAVTFMSPGGVCITDGVMTFNGGSPAGGIYSGPGVTDNGNGIDYDFDPAAAGLGMHTITYEYISSDGCLGSASDVINVAAPQPVTLTIPSALDTLCIDAGVQMISNAGSPTGGVYSGPGVTDDGNGISFAFDPAAAGPGLQLITYTVSGSDGCSGMWTDFIHVFDLPVVTFSIPAEQDTFCVNNAAEVISGGAPPGGVYTGPGVTDDGNGTSFTFDPAVAGAGFHIVTYTFTDDIGCSNSFDDFIHVLDLPVVDFTAPADLCIDAGVQSGQGGGTPVGGTYSGPGVTDDGNGMTYSFDPAAAGVGVHTITYTYTDGNGCTDSASDDVEVFALPIVSFTALADLCIDAGVQAGLGGGTPAGGTYSGPGVTDDGNGMTYSFDPAAAGVGVHTITYTYTDGNGCTDSASDDVEVFALPIVTFTALADLCIDAGVQAGQGGGSPTGGVYSGTGVTDDGNGMTYSFDPAAAGVGVHTITYTYTDGNGCTDSASDDVEVFALPIVSFTAPADLCIDAGVQAGLGGGTPVGGTYSGPGVTDDGNGMTYSFDPAAAGVGVHTITYTYTDSNGCTDSASDDVEVFALPIVTFTALADLCIDAGVQAGQGGGSPAGGVYSGTGVTDDGNGMTYSFDPAAAGVGVHTITYTYTDGNGCTDSASDDVEVFALPVVSFTALADLCIDAGVQAGQGGGSPTGGVYSGTGVTDDGNGMTYSFDPAAAGVGVHTITYTYTDGNGCTDSASDDVEVFPLPIVSFTAPADLCIDAGVQAGLGGGTPVGGTYSGPGVTDDGNGMTYSFDPAAAGVGVHTITYTYTDSNGCTDSASDDVEVFALPIVTFTALADLCIDAGVQAGQGGGSPAGGVYSGTGVTDDGNGMTYSFDPAAAGVGVHTITYTYTDGNGCTDSASDDVEVFALPVVSFTALADLCIDAGVQAGQGGGSPTGGVYSGTGVTDDGNGMTYSFDPAAAGVGVHTITYTYTDGNGCTDSASDDVEVFALPIVTFTAPADLCIDAGVQAGLGGGTPVGGTYSSPGVTDDGNGMTYSFDPAAAGVGVHTITYTYTDSNGCTDSASDDVEVFALPIVTFTALADLCIDAGVQSGQGGGSPAGGVYSGTGVTDDGNGMTYSFDPAAAGVGVHTITYTYTDGNGCTDSASDDVEVFALPVVSFTALADLCIDAGVQSGQGGGSPTGGVYSGTGVTDDGNGMTYSFDPAAAGVGVHTITYTYTDGNGCTDSASDDVEVFALPIVSFTALADLCIDAGVQAGLGGGTPVGGTYSGPGVTDDGNGMTYSFDPAAAGAGVHTITYTYTDGNGCTDSASDDVEVFALPIVSFTAPMDVCVDAGVLSGQGGGSPTGGVYSGTGVTDDGNGMTYSFDPAAAGVGVHTITYTYTDGNGCTDSASDDIEVFDLPTVAFTALADLCIDAGVQTMLGMGVPPGGVYSGPGVTDNGNGLDYDFDPAAAGVGVHTITYTYNDSNGCTGSWSDDVEVFALPIVSFTALADLCIDAGVQAGLGGGSPAGGVYSGAGVTDDGNGMTYSFDPAAAGAGVHTITYTYTDGNGCTDSASDDVEVFALPIVSFTAPADLCIDAGVQAGLGGGSPTGGVYSGTGVTDDGNGMTYSFDPAAAGLGVHTITYDYVDANGCAGSASDEVEVFDLPVVTLATAIGYCEDAPIQGAPITGGSPAGGVYSGIGVTDLGNGISYNFDPTVNGSGIVTITYTYTDANGCTNSAMSDLEVYDCAGVNDYDPDDPCQCLDNATIIDVDAGTGGDDGQFSELVSVSNATGAPLPPGLTWTVVGATGAWDAFNIPPVGVQSAGIPVPGDGSVLLSYNVLDGVYELPFVHVDDIGYTLMIEGPFPMGSAANVVLTISNKCQYPNPVFDPTIPDMINVLDPVITLGGTDTNGGTADGITFTVDGMPATMIDPGALALGPHTVVMTYDGASDGNGGISPDGGTTAASPGCIQEVTKDFEIVACDLVVDCSNIFDQTLACRADLPPVDFDLPIVIDSCGDVIHSALTIIPGDTGCPGDTLTITRTYFQQDANGNMTQCMQTFTVISTMDPVFTVFPADTTVLCGADTSPAALGMAEGAGECDPATPQATITSNDVITAGTCPAEMVITRTWTVTDRCGRSVDQDQIITVVDTIAPTMVCQDVTIELDANGMASTTADAVDNGSSDNCGGTVSLSLSMDAFTCDNLGTNDVWLIGEDECGNIDSCMAVVTVEDNIAPTITCPGDMELDNDPGVCGATVTYDVVADDNCTFNVVQTSGIPSGGFFPVGETVTNTFVVTDAAGLTAECSFTVLVNDVEGPVVDCPADFSVQLEAGECEEIVFYDIPFMDNCGTIDAEMSQAINEALVNDALDCLNNTSNHLRYFENTLPVPVEITSVSFGVFNAGSTETVEINIYTISPSADFEYANMNLAATVDYPVPAGMNNSILTAMIEASIPVGMNYVLELKANNTTNFVIGYNDQGETESTYISGNDPVPCVSLEPTDIDGLGFPGFAVVLYSNAEGGPSIEQTGGLPSGSYFPLGTTTNTFIVTDVYGNTTECEFDVTMVEFENGVTGVMACNDLINVSLDMNCEVVLGADLLLEGDVYGCYDDYIIEVSGGVAGNVITEPGVYTVTITDPDTGNSCWSTLNVEDKREPIIEDCACPVGGTEVVTPFVGTLDNNDPIWTRPFVAGGVCNPSGVGVDIPYDTYTFSLDMDANLNAEVVTFTAPSGDSFLALYEESFDPNDPCGNLVITNDDGGAGLLSQFDAMLNTGTPYILVVTTFNNNGNDYGDYVVEMTSDATLLEVAEECNFRCVDIEFIMGSDDLTPNPTVIACSDYETFFSDELTTDANGNQIIIRTWLATNANGSATCQQQFNIAPIQISELTLPISPVELSCNDGTSPEEIVAIFDNPLTQDNPNTSYVENNEGYVYAYPTYLINGHPQKVDNQVCDVYAAYTDQELDACAEGCNGNKKVIRTWTLVDWNTLETSTYVQTIKAVDTEAPTLITQDVTVSTDAWGCEASFEAPLPWELHDNCDSYPEYEISGPAGVVITGTFEEGYFISGAPKGVHTFNFIAYDCCGNQASYPFQVTVLDITPPVVVAKQNVVISLTSGSTSEDGLAKLYAESIDNGSYDGCTSQVKLEVRRDDDICDIRGNATYNADGHPQDGSPNPNSPSYDPDGGEYVKFCCEDLTNAVVDVNGDGENDPGYVKVWLRAWDDGDMDGVYGSAGDNYNEAWAYVKVEDKLAPAIQCPADVTLTCDMDYTDLNMTGSASAFGSCGGVDVEYNDIIVNLNSCNEGFVRRRWSVVDRSDIFCDQTITIEDLDTEVSVSFAQVGDFTAANCPDEIALGEPTWIAGPCDVIGYTMETDTFLFEDGACQKLVNHWTVINWCDYDPNNPFWNGEGLWEHVQVVKVTDETRPVIEDCDDKMYEVNDHSDSDDDGVVCEAKITLTNIATDEGSANCPTGWLKWQVFVDLWGDGTDDLEYSSFLPPFDTQFNDTNGNGIPDVYVSPTANGEQVSIALPDIVGSMSNHKVVWKVTDGCNNVTTCDSEFMVVDKKAPTPYCVNLSTAVMESTGTVELWAIDFNVGSFDNCSAQEDLRYTFSNVAPEDDPNYDADLRSSSMTFDCGDVENSPVELPMYVWDEKGNADFCLVYLTLVDNTGACGGKPDIAGAISTEAGLGVEEVEVSLDAALPEYPRLEMTDEEGGYMFVSNALNASYVLTGSKDVDYLNGVSTLDLVKIQRHILGLEELNSPYKLVAADVNADNYVKASDLTELRKLILGVITDLPTNESWRFVDSDQELSMDMDLADVDYTQEVENLQGNTMSKDFVAVKVGDVTENATTNLAGSSISEVRSNKALMLSIANQTVEAGQTVSVGFSSADFDEVFGYQFTMELTGLEFAGIESGALEIREGNVGVLSGDVVTMSYNSTTGVGTSKDEDLFTVQFVATMNGELANMIELTSKVTRSEAYLGQSLEIYNVAMETRGDVAEVDATELYQNEPNPFVEQTVIGFNLAEKGEATMTIFDVTGKVIQKHNIDGVKGYNTLKITAKELGASGVLYYTLESGDFTATKKMIIIE